MNNLPIKRTSLSRPMRQLKAWALTALICVTGFAATPAMAADDTAPPAVATASTEKLDNATCESCHDGKKGKLQAQGADGEKRDLHAIAPDKFGKSVHAKVECVACHTNIVDATAQHKIRKNVKTPDCAQCHQALWDKAKQDGTAASKPRLETVAKNIAAYKKSFHAGPDKDNPTQPKASCTQCHDTHTFNVPADKKSAEYAQWRKNIPNLCGTCHEDQLETYTTSKHGTEVLEEGNAKAAVCTSCHTNHEITNTSLSSFKLLVTDACGSCHKERMESYGDTYHGQVTRLGNVDTAKCYNCHGSHDILPVKDPESKVNPKNRLKTCKQCHDGKKRPEATAGFVSFAPHATTHDFAKYPQMWIAAKFMEALLIGVFAFFWAHSGLWYYREWKDRKEGKCVAHVKTAALAPELEKKFFKRFPVGWRIAHLCFALVTMTLVLSGTTALFSHTNWAPVVSNAVGGSKHLANIHRVAAILFVSIFFIHFVYVMQKLLRDKTFRWFGPDSLIPNWKDIKDCIGMFKWFFGKGERPMLDRWAYYEKFDYWAVFWGVNIIGFSGLMLAFPHISAKFLPGWVFNVATLVHGEEAFLAAVFLFTVHFFNNHFRPDKLPPPDIVMFTGTQSLEEFRHEHPAQYQRMVDSGEIEKYLVDAPSQPMRRGSKILGLTLIAIGLTLLVLVLNGFLTQ